MINQSPRAREVLAYQLRELREKKGYSQEMLADLSGLNRSYIGRVERHEHSVGLDNLERIAEGLEVEIARLLDLEKREYKRYREKPNKFPMDVVVKSEQFLEVMQQCAVVSKRPELVLVYLQRCGVKFV